MNNNKTPKNQILWMTYKVDGVPKYLVTSNKVRNKYNLYRVNKDGSLDKVKSSATPMFKEVGN